MVGQNTGGPWKQKDRELATGADDTTVGSGDTVALTILFDSSLSYSHNAAWLNGDRRHLLCLGRVPTLVIPYVGEVE